VAFCWIFGVLLDSQSLVIRWVCFRIRGIGVKDERNKKSDKFDSTCYRP